MSAYKLSIVLGFFLIFCIIYSCHQNGDESTGISQSHKFVGGQTCQSCHEKEWEDWQGSHHDYAIAEADSASVRADFNDTEFTKGDGTYRFFRDGEKYMVEAPGPEGSPEIFEITYTFGWEPLQQYLVDFGKGMLQALQVAWDTEREEWFNLQPDEEPQPGDWLHWTGTSMNWNTMCADCHSTNLRQNYIAEADSFHTTWSEIDVSCEACHGPGQDHVEFMNSPEAENASYDRILEDVDLPKFVGSKTEINTCAPCHSFRQELNTDYVHGDDFMNHFDPMLPHPDNYFADGQIKGEVYVYGSFLQSKMYDQNVKCSNCHNPHTLELKASITDNTLCMSCHEPSYNTPEHHFHEQNTESSMCVNCHMTGRYYMEVDYRRDHSFRIPRPDQTAQFGTPNACNDCHTDQTPEWAGQAIEDWYGEDRAPHYSDILVRADANDESVLPSLREFAADTSQPDIIRATAVWYAGRFPDTETADMIREALESESVLVRKSAAKAVENLPPEMRTLILRNAISDSMRAVRISAMQNLVAFTVDDIGDAHKDHFRNALEEYKTYLEANRYFPQGEMNRGQFLEQRGEIEEAIEAYQTALERDPEFNPARINLAYIYNNRGQNDRAEELLKTVIEQEPDFGEAYYSLGLLLAEEQRLKEAISYFEEATKRLPRQSRIFYNLAVANQTVGQPVEAENAYLQAIDREPNNGDYRYGLITLYMQQEQYEKALEHAEVLEEIHPDNQRVQQLLRMIRDEL